MKNPLQFLLNGADFFALQINMGSGDISPNPMIFFCAADISNPCRRQALRVQAGAAP